MLQVETSTINPIYYYHYIHYYYYYYYCCCCCCCCCCCYYYYHRYYHHYHNHHRRHRHHHHHVQTRWPHVACPIWSSAFKEIILQLSFISKLQTCFCSINPTADVTKILCLGAGKHARIRVNITDQSNWRAFKCPHKQLIIDWPLVLNPLSSIFRYQHRYRPSADTLLSPGGEFHSG